MGIMDKTTEAIYKYLDSQYEIIDNVIHVDCIDDDFNGWFIKEIDSSPFRGYSIVCENPNFTIIDQDIEMIFGVSKGKYFWDWSKNRIGDKLFISFNDGKKLKYENEITDEKVLWNNRDKKFRDYPHDVTCKVGYINGVSLFEMTIWGRFLSLNHTTLTYINNSKEILLFKGTLEDCEDWNDVFIKAEKRLMEYHLNFKRTIEV